VQVKVRGLWVADHSVLVADHLEPELADQLAQVVVNHQHKQLER